MNAIPMKERLKSAMVAMIDEAQTAGAERFGMQVNRVNGGWTVYASGAGSWQSWFVGDIESKAAGGDPSATAPNTTPDARANRAHDDGQNLLQGSEAQGEPEVQGVHNPMSGKVRRKKQD